VLKGKVRWFDDKKGIGFIEQDTGGRDVFVHYTGIAGPKKERKTLEKGQPVEYEIETGDRGTFATNVRVIGQV
jgi:CspA family cold shock protein